jgi:hypothetical protein
MLRGRNSVARVTTAGVIDAEFTIPTPNAGALHVTSGPQGALWFTEGSVDKVGKITTDGVITQYPLAAGATPQAITEGADGAPWFAESGANRIARLDLGGPVDETAPTIEIRSPLTGTPFVLDQQSPADYECTDEPGGSGVAVCAGPVANGESVPTTSIGEHTFAVHAEDGAGNHADAATDYLVFHWIGGALVEPSPRPGSWLTLSLGMDLDPHAADPLASAVAQQVSCADGSPIGSPTVESLRTRIAHDGGLELRWRSDRAWAGSCRTLTLSFSSTDWDGASATFLLSFGSALRIKR